MGMALEELERPRAKERMMAGTPCGTVPQGSGEKGQEGQIREIVGEAVTLDRPPISIGLWRAKRALHGAFPVTLPGLRLHHGNNLA